MAKSKFDKFLSTIQIFSDWNYVISADQTVEEFYQQVIAENLDFENVSFEEFKKWVTVDYVRFCGWIDDDYEFTNQWWLWQNPNKKWTKKVRVYESTSLVINMMLLVYRQRQDLNLHYGCWRRPTHLSRILYGYISSLHL